MRAAASAAATLLIAASLMGADPAPGTMIVSTATGSFCGLTLVAPQRFAEHILRNDETTSWLRSTDTAPQRFAPLPDGGVLRVPGLKRLGLDSEPLPEGSGWLLKPRRPAVDGNGNIYVVDQRGFANEPFLIVRFTSTGQRDAEYVVPPVNGSVDGIELAADGCTLFLAVWRSLQPSIARYDLCRRELRPDLAVLDAQGYALRALRDGTLLVSRSWSIVRLDANGAVVRTYQLPPPYPSTEQPSRVTVIALTPDETAVWIGEAKLCASGARALLMRLSDGAIIRAHSFSDSEVAEFALFGEQRVTFVPTPPARTRATRRR